MQLIMQWDIYVIILLILATVSQVLIGVGVLLWGTPLLLILGYTFLNVLQILLPVSLCISFLQILLYRKYIDFNLLKKYSVTSLPGIVIGLLLTIYFSLNLNVAVGMTLILVVLSRTFPRYVALGGFFIKNKLPVMFVIGVIHGFTNLGGALLVTIISFEKLSKNSYVALIASLYFLFAASQLLTLLMSTGSLNVNLTYIGISMSVFFLVDRFIFYKFSEIGFRHLITIFLLLVAILLLLKSNITVPPF